MGILSNIIQEIAQTVTKKGVHSYMDADDKVEWFFTGIKRIFITIGVILGIAVFIVIVFLLALMSV